MDYQELMQQGQQCIDQQNYQDAFQIYEQASEQNPTSAEVFYKIGYTSIKTGNIQKAIQTLQASIDLDHRHWQALILLGELLYNEGEILKGVEHLKDALIFKNSSDVYDSLDLQIFQNSDLQTLIQKYSTQLYSDPNNTQVLVLRGLAQTKQGDIQSAIQDFDQIDFILGGQNQDKLPAMKNRLNNDYKKINELLEENSTRIPVEGENFDLQELQKQDKLTNKIEQEQQQQEQQAFRESLNNQQTNQQVVTENNNENQQLVPPQGGNNYGNNQDNKQIQFRVSQQYRKDEKLQDEKCCCSIF